MEGALVTPQQYDLVDPAAVAAAESVKARIQAAYAMAARRERNEAQARDRILEACRRPEFAERVEFSKPIGNTKVKGPSIRFAELALREWGNILSEVQVLYEDDGVRRIRVSVLDLQTNSQFSKDVQIKKTVERKSKKGREEDIVSERVNSFGDKVFILRSTEEELYTKEAGMISRVLRNEGLRLIPSDVTDEALSTARETLARKDAKDPKAAVKKVLDAFSGIGIKPKNLEAYLGQSTESISPAQLKELRGMFAAIRDGEATWADYMAKSEEKNAKANDLTEKIKGKKQFCAYSQEQPPREECGQCPDFVDCEKAVK